MITSGAQGPVIAARPPLIRSWTLSVSGLAHRSDWRGWARRPGEPLPPIALPVYYFNEVNPGSTWTPASRHSPSQGRG